MKRRGWNILVNQERVSKRPGAEKYPSNPYHYQTELQIKTKHRKRLIRSLIIISSLVFNFIQQIYASVNQLNTTMSKNMSKSIKKIRFDF